MFTNVDAMVCLCSSLKNAVGLTVNMDVAVRIDRISGSSARIASQNKHEP